MKIKSFVWKIPVVTPLISLVTLLKNIRKIRTMPEFAESAGLPIVYLDNRPANYPGYLDWNDEPRFIAVNRDLPKDEQAWFIAQQVAFCAQQRGVDSLILSKPWKWNMLKIAPIELKEKILAIDQEYRANGFMMLFANKEEYKPYAKKHGIFEHFFTDNIVNYHLYKLRIKFMVESLFRKLLLVRNPVS